MRDVLSIFLSNGFLLREWVGSIAQIKGPDGTYRDRLGVLQFLKELNDSFIKRL